jgi:YD repeat-containing protein
VALYAYDALGNLLSASLPNGTASAWEHDELGRPVAALNGLGPVAPALALTVDSLDFGSAPVGTSRQLPLDLYNQGTAPLTVSGVTVSAPFSVVFSGPATIPSAGTLRVTVAFTPIDQVPASANLSITSDDPETPLAFVALSGEGARKIAGLQATPAQDGIQLTWTLFSPGSQPFGHFNIYRSLSPIPGSVNGLTPFDTSLTSASATNFLDKLATPGTSYYYAVTPVYASGDENKDVDAAGPVAYFTTFGPLAADLALATTSQSETRPAIAYNSTANNYLVVYERQVSATDTDVYGQWVSATGSLLGSAFAIANTSARQERRPRAAYNAIGNNFLVVWEYDASGNGSNYDLRVGPVSATGTVGAVVTVANLPRQELTPEIIFGTTSREYLVAYEMDGNADGKTDVGLVRLSAAGAVLDAVFLTLRSNALDVHATKPFLAYNNTLNDFMLAFEVDAANDGSNIEIWETRIKPDLTLVNGFLYYVAHGAGHDRNPYLAYDSGHNEYLAAWENDAAGTGANLDVYSTKISATGSTIGAVIGIANQSDIEKNPRAVYNRNLDDFVLAWERGGATPRIQGRRIHFTLSSLQTQSTVDISSGTTSRKRPDIGTSTTNNTFLVIWDEDAGAGNFDMRSRLLGTFAPALQVSPASLSFSGTTTHQTLTITNGNPSGGPLQWTAIPDRPWMAAQPGSGSTTSSVAVDVAVDRTGLVPGTYTGTVGVTSNNGSSNVPVTLIVGNIPPDTPNAPRPTDGATDQSSVSGGMDLTLGWQGGDADGDSVTWAVYLSTDSARVTALDAAVRIGQGLATPSLMPAGLNFLKQYFWRIVATDSRGASTTGPVWRFTTAAVAAPSLHPVTPDPTRETRPTLGWQAVAGAATYHLQVADNVGFSPRTVDATGITATSFMPASSLPEGTIYWRVRSVDAAGQPGAFSVPDIFVVDTTAAGVPVLVPVTPDPTNNPQPALAWGAVTGASSYRVQVAGTSDFTDPFIDTTLSTLAYQPASDLPEGQVYWRAASLDAAGNQSAFSGADLFTLDATPPPAIAGLTAHRQGAGVDLAWEPLTGPPADFARFRIYRAEAPFTNVTGITLLNESLTSAAAVSFLDSAASPGVAYWYAVTAVDTAENENREVMVAHVPANESPAVPVLVAPAVGAQVLPAGTMTVALAWTASDPENDPLRFEVYLSTEQAQVAGTPDITARIAESLTTPMFETPGLTYQKLYYWRVVALDLAADGSVRSATFGPLWSFAIPAIPAPALTALAPDPTQQRRPTFTWQSVPGAAGYRIEIASDPSFGSTLVATEVTVTSFTPAADLPEGLLYWHVRAIDVQGLPGAFSAADNFVLDATAPVIPALVPVTPDPTSNRRPSLGWGSVTDASSYRVQLSIEAGFTSPLADTTVSSPLFIPASDLPEGRIYWRVASKDAAANQSAFSAADDFLVDTTAPAVPVLVPVAPDPTSNRRPNLGWGAVADASSYRVQVSTDAGFTSPLIDTTVSSPLFVPTTDLPESRIYWRVASKDAASNQSAFSAGDDFLVDVTAPAVPVLVPVMPDPTSIRRPNLAWGAMAGAGTYRVQISNTLDFAAPLIIATVSTTSYQPISDLPEGRIYWRVASLDVAGNQSAFSAADDFLVDVTPPPVPSLVPVTPDPISNLRPFLGWSALADVTHYRVQVSSAPDFATPLVDTTVSLNTYQPSSDLPEGRIYWRVASLDPVGNQSAFSPADDFLVDSTAPAVPVLVPVTPDPTSNPRPNFGWGAVADAASYRIQVSTDASFGAPLINVTVAGGPYVPTSDLPEGRLYWRVSSMDLAGNPSAFALSSFTSDRTPPPAVAGPYVDWASTGTRLTWPPFSASITDVAFFRIYRSESPFAEVTGRTPIANLNSPVATSFDDSTAAHGVMLHYAVTAVDLAGNELKAVSSVATPPPGGDLYVVAPCRVLDTRNPSGPFGGPALVALQPRSFSFAGRCDIPATARAVVANVTVVGPTASGLVKAYPGGIASPLVNTVNFSAGQVRTNNGLLVLQPGGSGALVLEAVMPAGASVHVAIDISGYFE